MRSGKPVTALLSKLNKFNNIIEMSSNAQVLGGCLFGNSLSGWKEANLVSQKSVQLGRTSGTH